MSPEARREVLSVAEGAVEAVAGEGIFADSSNGGAGPGKSEPVVMAAAPVAMKGGDGRGSRQHTIKSRCSTSAVLILNLWI